MRNIDCQMVFTKNFIVSKNVCFKKKYTHIFVCLMKIDLFQFRCSTIPICIDIDFGFICVPTIKICFKLSICSKYSRMKLHNFASKET